MVNTFGLTLENICFEIGSFQFKNLCMNINPKEYFVLTGPNGTGKTLIIKIICGIYQPSSGKIVLNGREIQDIPIWERNIGYVPQNAVLFASRTVSANIEFGLEVRKIERSKRKEKVQEIAGLLNISHLLERKPNGLSGGEQQKVALARALVLKPSALLLDEPLSAIDESTRDELCKELRSIQQKLSITTLHISHNKEEMRMVGDRIGSLQNGNIIEMKSNDRTTNDGKFNMTYQKTQN